MWIVDDLIVAPATDRAGGGRGIVRLAGPGLADLLERLLAETGAPADPVARAQAVAGRAARIALLREISVADGGTIAAIPIRLLEWPEGRGPLGMAAAELHLPGSVPLVDAIVARCLQLGARLARGGEFSLRAFLAGRLDLVQAEAVLAVVDARTPEDLSAALDRLSGGLGSAVEAERRRLLDVSADLEAMIDFGDEAIDPAAHRTFRRDLATRLDSARSAIARMLAHLGHRAASAVEGARVVLVGPPNIGKSSLYNALLERSAALVSDEAGTTRDYLEAVVGGGQTGRVEYVLIDVAGIHWDGVEKAGQLRGVAAGAAAAAREQTARADVLVHCRDAATAEPFPLQGGMPQIHVLTRCDRVTSREDPAGPAVVSEGVGAVIRTSSRTGLGIESLRQAIHEAVVRSRAGTPATLRMAEGLLEAHEAVGLAADEVSGCTAGDPASIPPDGMTPDPSFDEAVVASHLGRAVAALAAITGREVGGDLLDRIFSRHCIGK